MNKNDKWETLSSELALDHPFIRITMDTVLLPDGNVIEDWPTVHAGDYATALIINNEGKGLIFEGYRHGPERICWQLVGGYVNPEEDAFTAIQREVYEETGFECGHWRHLSSFVVDANRKVGVGHFFLGYGPKKVAEPNSGDLETVEMKWVHIKELKRALWDGRFSVMSYGANVALALLALENQ